MSAPPRRHFDLPFVKDLVKRDLQHFDLHVGKAVLAFR